MDNMNYSQRYELIKNIISADDYNRAKFVLYCGDTKFRVRKNLFRFYDHAEIKQCALYILNNYDNCEYTFNTMSHVADDKFTARMLRASVPYWKRAINAYIREYNKHISQR